MARRLPAVRFGCERRPRQLQHRNGDGGQHDGDRHAEPAEHDTPVGQDGGRTQPAAWIERQHRRHEPRRREHTAGAAGCRDDQALHDLRRGQVESRRAERGADGELAPPEHDVGQREVGQIGDRDGGQRERRGEQQQDGGPLRSVLCPSQIDDAGRQTLEHVGREHHHAGLEAAELRRRLERRDTWPEPADGLNGGQGQALGALPDVERRPELGRREPRLERRRHDAEDGERLAVEGQRPADDARLGAEAAEPQSMAQHDDLRAGLHFRLGERPANQWGSAEQLEESGRHPPGRHAVRLAVARHRTVRRPDPLEPGEGSRVVAEVEEHNRIERVGVAEVGRVPRLHVDADQPTRVGKRQRPQEGHVGNGEDCVDRRDDEHEGEDASGTEARPLRERAQRQPGVGGEGVHPPTIPAGRGSGQMQIRRSAVRYSPRYLRSAATARIPGFSISNGWPHAIRMQFVY